MDKRMVRVTCDLTISVDGYSAGSIRPRNARSATTAATARVPICTPGCSTLPTRTGQRWTR